MTDGAGATTAAVEAIEAAGADGRLSEDSVANIRRWLDEPQYAKYRPRLLALIEAERFDDLDAWFWEVIDFGTGGRRGPMSELGSATINERTIAESAHGLATYLHEAKGESGGRAVVACDTRNRSQEFARLTATTLAANGLKVFVFDEHRATPELSFAVRHLQCDVGVMISASHNPPSDNGFKAYWSHGGQVLDKEGRGIIECVERTTTIPELDFDTAVADGKIEIVGHDIDEAYLAAVTAQSLSEARDVPALFSPLHGVGETAVFRALERAGFGQVEIYEPQRAPDGNFTNVPDRLPNPERHEVFAPLIEHAKRGGAEVILASDPDADRIGVAVKGRDGEFSIFTGNRVGGLLVDYVLRKRSAAGTLSSDHYVVETLVTTPLFAAIGRRHGVQVVDDLLVGFKYIGETMEKRGPDEFVFGAEESLGYLAGSYARDKDAALAALYVMELAAELRAEGRTLLDRLDELFVEHGYFVEGQRSKDSEGPRGKEQIDGLIRAFREDPPRELAGISLERVRDYGGHEIRALPANDKTADLPEPRGNLLFFDSADGDCRVQVAVRPSGTEPKIKFYFFAQAPIPEGGGLDEIKTRTEATFARVQDALSDWVGRTLQSV